MVDYRLAFSDHMENVCQFMCIDNAHVICEEDEHRKHDSVGKSRRKSDCANYTNVYSTSVITTIVSSVQTKDECNSSL
jgi:hypothetical protein